MNEIKLTESPEYKNLPLRGRWAIDNIIQYAEELQQEKKKLNAQIETLSNFQPAQKLKDYIAKPKTWEEEKDGWYGTKKDARGYTIYKPVITPEQLQEWLNKNEPIYQENVKICENNKRAQSLAYAFLKKLGLPEEKYDYPSSRSKTKQKMTCAWVGEIGSFFATSCDYGWAQDKKWVEEESKKIAEYYSKQEAIKEAAKKAEEAKLKEQEKTAQIIKMVEKYQLKFNSPIPEISEVVEQIAKKNKYLYLARYLAKNRDDWNDGYSYAEIGLNYFISQHNEETEETDSAIYEDINQYFADFDDGRVFRDCTWNYSKLYEIAGNQNKELMDDYSKLTSYE